MKSKIFNSKSVMIMKKKLFLAAVAIGMLASCADNEYVGEVSPNLNFGGNNQTIVFNSGAKTITRADYTGADAAGKLNNNFVVYGFKGDGTTQEKVFDHYNVNWKDNTANTTTSNTANWEYVAQPKHDLASTANQTIKYWDYATTQYDFIAWSKGLATAVYATEDYDKDANVLITATTPATMTSATGGAYTIKGKAENLAKMYIADLVTAYREPVATGDYQKEVEIKFRSLSAKVRVALYETVPGYSVRDVEFYTNASTKATDGKAHLYTMDGEVFNEEGTYTVYYPTVGSAKTSATDYNKAHLSFAAETSGTATVKDFGVLDLTNTAKDKETAEAADKVYLGRASNEATYAGDNAANHYTVVIPNETGAVLNLKVNYKLVSTDGSGEDIDVTGATAQVPAVYGAWKSGYAYTYIFKISQNTNGLTNPSAGPAGLWPITFDALVSETEDGVQETITTVATPSITTYAKGVVVTGNNEYTTGSNIYAVVENGTALTVGTNANLYTVDLQDGAAQTINEASVANAIANGGAASPFVVTDANGKMMTVTAASGLTAVNEIAAADAPNGNAITVNGAKFTPSAAGTYVFEYIQAATYVSATGTYVTGTTYYSDDTGSSTVDTSTFEAGVTDVSSYYVVDTPGAKYYKIIKVVAAP